jgi:hypothetical protein
LFSVDTPVYRARDSVEVEGKIFVAGLSGAGYRYYVVCKGGRWTVLRKTLLWES